MALKVSERGLPPVGPSGYVLTTINGEPKWSPTSDAFPQVTTYADLPDPELLSGQLYYVTESSGVWLLSRKQRGWYRSNGISWDYGGELLESFRSDHFQIYDSIDPSKSISFNSGPIRASTNRVITVPDRDITLGEESNYSTESSIPCDNNVNLNDWVYLDGGTLKSASASSIETAQVIGFVVNKPTPTTADIISAGISPAVFNLTPDMEYFLSIIPGQLTTSLPTASEHVIVSLGRALSSSKLVLNIQLRLIRS